MQMMDDDIDSGLEAGPSDTCYLSKQSFSLDLWHFSARFL